MKKEKFTQSNNSGGIAAKRHLTGLSVAGFVNNDGCFDLQFRKDTRHERTNSPTYYRWKAQFVVTSPKDNVKILGKIRKEMGCGKITVAKGQARFSVQKIDDITAVIIPYFKKNILVDKKKILSFGQKESK